MTQIEDSIIKTRLNQLLNDSYDPQSAMDALEELYKMLSDNQNAPHIFELINKLQQGWRSDLLEAYKCMDKLQDTIIQYEEELNMMMEQMDALVKCSVLIKQYSLYLKNEIENVADKIDRKGLDEKIDQLVDLLEEMKPKRHLNLVRETEIIEFPK